MSADNFNVQVKVTPKAQEFQQDLQKVADKIVVNVNVKMSGQQEVKDLNKDLKDLTDNAKKASDAAKDLGNSLDKVDKDSKSLGQSFGDIVTKVGKFYLATKPIQMMQQAFDEALQSVKDFDDAMTDLRKVSDLDGQALTDYTIKLGELGEAVYRSRTEMTEAAVLFKQTGASDEDAAKLAQLANLYMNVADNEMTAADASAYITSQMKAFKITANDAISILDKTNEVSNKFAVSSSDISRALTTSSASLAVYGNDINDTIALVTAGTEIMTGKAQQVGRGLRSIGANIAALASSAGELEFQVNGTTKTISLIDEETGDMINTFEALSRIHEYWDEMTASEQAALATSLAGKTQLDVFSSTLSNFNTAIEANTVAVESNGSAWEENNKRADSISTKLNLLKSQFQELVLGKGGLQEFAKNLLDVGIGALQLVNNLGGLPSVITAITTAIIALNATKILTGITKAQTEIFSLIGLIGNFKVSLKGISAAWTAYSVAMSSASTATTGAVSATEALNTAISVTAPLLKLISLVIGGIIIGINSYNKRLEDMKQAEKEHNEELRNSISSFQNAQTALQNESISRDELNSVVDSNISAYKDEIDQIEDVNEARQRAIDLIKEESKEKLQQYLNEGKQEYKEAISAVSSSTYQDYMAPSFSKKNFQKESLNQAQQQIVSSRGIEELTSSYNNYLSVLNEEIEKVEEGSIAYNDYREEIYRVKEALSTLETDEQNYKAIISAYNDALISQGQIYDETTGKIRGITTEEYVRYAQQKQIKEATDEATDSLEGYADDLGETADYLSDLAKQAGVSEEELTSLAESLNASVESVAEWLSGANDFSDSLSDLSSAYETLKEAADEYNSTGVYSAETMSKLLSMSPELVASLQEENGQLVVNEAVLQNAANAMIDEAEATLLTKAQMEIANIMAGAFDETLVGVGNDSITTGENVATAGEKALQSGMNANTGAEGWLNFWSAATEGQGTVNDAKTAEAMARAEDSYKKQYEALEELRDKVGQYGKASASAHSKSAKATDKEKSAVDQLKDKYKTVIDFILKQYDKQIDKIKEAKDAAIKSVESQIKALEKEKDSKVKAIDAEITSLQRQRDAREKYWQDQLDKLEKENNERERNIALQEKQQALALAQQSQVMVLQDGQFQYTQDESAVAGAEQDVAQQEDQNEYERQKELIEELRDTELEWYDERIQALEDYKEQVEEYYEEQIEQLEEYKEYLEEYYEAQIEALEAEKEAVNATLEEGAANQQEYWDKMKEQLQTFVEEWNALVGEMTFPNISGSGISLSAVGGKISASMGGKSTGDNKVSAYASGKGSIGDSEIAVVGENPKYRELVIGSKLNNDQGVVMSLKRGSGVVNAGATNTLASIFNSLNGQKSIGQAVSNNSQSMSIQIGSISLPEVKDGQGFVDYLQNFSADITQQSFRRA